MKKVFVGEQFSRLSLIAVIANHDKRQLTCVRVHMVQLGWSVPVAATLRCRMRVFTHQTLLFGQSEPEVSRRQLSDHSTSNSSQDSPVSLLTLTHTLTFVYANGSDKHSKIRNEVIAFWCNSRKG